MPLLHLLAHEHTRDCAHGLYPVVMWLYMVVLAYLFSFVVYQGGLALGLGA